jgi:hypothetical protein
MENIINKIKETGYITNKKIGGVFHMKYPDLYKEIIVITKDIEKTYVVNKNLRARVIFILKYNANIENIKHENTWLTFDRNIDDFIFKSNDYVKNGWKKIKEKANIYGYYGLSETIELLNNNEYYLNFLGKSKNRTMLKNAPKLYNSILKHTECLNTLNINSKKFSMRILFLVKTNGDINKIKCKCCGKNVPSFNVEKKWYNCLCYSCFNNSDCKYPNKGWFKIKYEDDWELAYNKYKTNNAIMLSNYNKGYSQISQKLFWLIYNLLPEYKKSKCFFKELNNEWFINDGINFYFCDFKIENKIIEYDGMYWHNNFYEKDEIRNNTYKKMGFKVLILNENDFSEKNINTEAISKCLKFINDEK